MTVSPMPANEPPARPATPIPVATVVSGTSRPVVTRPGTPGSGVAVHGQADAPAAQLRLPKYYQVKKQLLELTSAMAPGSPVPPERELARQYETSRTTVRQALAELVVEGRLLRMQGKGTFVAKPKVAQVLELASYTEGMRQHGLHPQTQDPRRRLRHGG